MKPKNLFLFFCCLAFPLLSYGQQHLQRAEKVLHFLTSQQGDSIFVQLKKEDQEILKPETINATFAQLEKLFGKYQSINEWKTYALKGDTIYYTDMQFTDASCRFLISFNDDLTVNKFNITPISSSKLLPAEPILMDSSRIEERQIQIVHGEYKLPGTFTFPKGQTHVPVAILVHGSGPQDRDQTAGPNKPFRDLAWGLAERGVATIRYDKRTLVYGAHFAPIGSRNYDTESCDDALEAIKLAQDIELVDKKKIYVIGHSLGGALVPRLAERAEGDLAGIIVMAGLARSFEDPLVEQFEYIASVNGPSVETDRFIKDLKEQVINVKKMGTDAFNDSIPLPLNLPADYWEFAIKYKPTEVARTLSIPILILQGERDYNVTMEDFALWRASLFRNPKASFKSYPKLNHLFQEGTGKATPMEYSIQSAIAPYFIDDIASWIINKQISD